MFLALDIDQFLVGARLDVNDAVVGGTRGLRRGVDRRLHRRELVAPVGRHVEIRFRRQPAHAHRQDDERH